MFRTSTLAALVLTALSTSVAAQDFMIANPGGASSTNRQPATSTFRSSSPDMTVSTSSTSPRTDFSFDVRKHQKRYEEVLADLREMKPADAEEGDSADWFVVGGAITDKRSGQSMVKFNKVQGEEALAFEVVKFLYSPRGNLSIGWRVFERSQSENVADQELASVQEEYRQWQVKQAELQRERQQRIARSQARAASQSARATSFFRGSSRCGPGGG